MNYVAVLDVMTPQSQTCSSTGLLSTSNYWLLTVKSPFTVQSEYTRVNKHSTHTHTCMHTLYRLVIWA